jgi:ABC-type multidrug transport system, ATPase and permease components
LRPIGCGKTTLIDLLMRFYDAHGSFLKVSGTDVCEVTCASLRGITEWWCRILGSGRATMRKKIINGKPEAALN